MDKQQLVKQLTNILSKSVVIRKKNYRKNETITSYINNRSHLFILLSGAADLEHYEASGALSVIEHISANDIFGELLLSGASPETYVKEKGLVQISDSSALESAVDEVLAATPAEVEAYRGGKTKLISFFVGQVMRATRGKANPALVNELLAKKL